MSRGDHEEWEYRGHTVRPGHLGRWWIVTDGENVYECHTKQQVRRVIDRIQERETFLERINVTLTGELLPQSSVVYQACTDRPNIRLCWDLAEKSHWLESRCRECDEWKWVEESDLETLDGRCYSCHDDREDIAI